MVRNYKRKTDKEATSPRRLERAFKLVESGWSVRGAARQENMKKSSLWDFCQKMQKSATSTGHVASTSHFKLSHASRNIFTDDQEETISSYCIRLALMGYGLTVEKVRELAWEVAEKNNIQVPPNWSKKKLAGIDWFYGFKKRHSELSIRSPEACSLARAMAFNKITVEKYYEDLKSVLNRHNSFRSGSRVYNLDETNTSTVQNTKKIVSPKGVKQLHQIKTAERGVFVTTTVIIGAHGALLPPAMIFPRKIFKGNMLLNAFPGSLGLANVNGYNTKETFVDIMKHFINCTNSSKENPTLLLMDNVDTHFSIKSLDLAKENGVVIFTFPPHCTHKLQPLDVGFFGPFKKYYDSAIQAFILSNPGMSVTIYHVAGFVKEAIMKAGAPTTIINSFQKPRIIPFDPNVFVEHDFLMASVTEQPDPTVEPPVNQALVEQPLNIVDQPENNGDELVASVDVTESSVSFISPEAIRGLPHAKPNPTSNRKPRRKGKSMVATDSPERQAITEREEEVNRKKQKAEERKRKKDEKGGKEESAKKRKGRQTNVTRVLTYDSNSEDSDENNSEIVDDVAVVDKTIDRSFPPLDRSPLEEDYVLVRFKSKDEKYYVGKILQEEDDDGDFQISYMRSTGSSPPRFVLPPIPDLHSVHKNDITCILPKPSYPANTTRRQQSLLQFEFEFFNVKLG